MAQEQNIFQLIASGVGNANQNIVDTYKLLEEVLEKVNEIHSALFQTNIAEPTSDGTTTNDK
jgi:hypothetical protein